MAVFTIENFIDNNRSMGLPQRVVKYVVRYVTNPVRSENIQIVQFHADSLKRRVGGGMYRVAGKNSLVRCRYIAGSSRIGYG